VVSIAENPTLLGADCGNCKRSLKVGRRKAAQPASALNTDKPDQQMCALGRRTIWTADRRHSRLVSARRGASPIRVDDRGSTRMAGNSVTAARTRSQSKPQRWAHTRERG
jgi:hypothetical protein